MSITLTNHLGQPVMVLSEREVSNSMLELDLTSRQLTNGVYFVTVQTADGDRKVKQVVLAR